MLAVFLAITAVLARVLSLAGAERSAISTLVVDEAAGNSGGAISLIDGCAHRPACRASVAADVAKLSRPGAVAIIQIQPSAGFALSSTVGTARVAWRVGFSLPIVQCVRVRRAGDAIGGFQVQLLGVTPRIPTDAVCPARF
ncbi:MAG TPA: hypothetical protein VIX82_15755 [Solirubrobacteraceae bacterium]